MDKKYEIILYGATGFTGQICCKYLRDNYPDLVWAMAGRNKEKLEQIKLEALPEIKNNIRDQFQVRGELQ